MAAWRRKRIIIVTALTVFLDSLYSFQDPDLHGLGLTPHDREPNILSFEDIFQIDSLNDDYFQTQFKLLQSRALAGDTIDRLRLDENGALVKAAAEGGRVRAEDLKNDPGIRRGLINDFLARLTIRPVRKTRLVQASFSHPDPKFAAETLNALFEAYIEMNVQKRFQATEQATDFLTKQIATLQAEIEESEKSLQQYGAEKNIIALSSTENTVIEKLGELNKALTDAQIDRVNKETYYNEIAVATRLYPRCLGQSADPEAQRRIQPSEPRICEEERNLPSQLPRDAESQGRNGHGQEGLGGRDSSPDQAGLQRIPGALKREQALAGVFNRQKNEAFQLNSNAIEYNSLQIQIQNSKNLLESLMKRKSETDVSSRLKGLRTSNIWIVDRQEVPFSQPQQEKEHGPCSRDRTSGRNGIGVSFESLDVTVKDSEDVKNTPGCRCWGLSPEFLGDGLKRVR
jgi:uncharacterized protein involved in exopolysaccharide biosynthesis